MTNAAPEHIKACCAAAYGSEAATLLLGDSFHPGGLALTRQLARVLDLRAGQRVLDVASGRGTTAIVLATEFEVSVEGVDLSADNVANARAAAQGLDGKLRFTVGDAEKLPFEDGSFDAVVCECALCLFPAKPAALAEVCRVLAEDGRVGITDLTVRTELLPDELRGLAGWVACIADARTTGGYVDLLASAGLRPTRVDRHDDALAALVDRIGARLRAIEMLSTTNAPLLPDLDLNQAYRLIEQAAQAVRDGAAGYVLIVAEKHQ